jgi:hypothetical protein
MSRVITIACVDGEPVDVDYTLVRDAEKLGAARLKRGGLLAYLRACDTKNVVHVKAAEIRDTVLTADAFSDEEMLKKLFERTHALLRELEAPAAICAAFGMQTDFTESEHEKIAKATNWTIAPHVNAHL